jgi:CMP/dCMP kinase
MKKIVIAIDGFSACGKSSTAKVVASFLNYAYIDTGAMYRAVTLYFHEHYVNITDPKAVEKALEDIHITFVYNPKTKQNETFLNGLNVESEIRKMYISEKVSEVSALPAVRRAMVAQQKKMGKKKGVVMDGRDIGTAVFPDAELKIFMQADFDVRAERRQAELLERKQLVNFDEVKENLRHRDELDTTRQESPLRRADDAYLIDTTHVTLEEQVEQILNLATGKIFEKEEQNAN